ncbi:Bifunctional hemolysin/adenylate cyclase precursor [compost metagenome]
MLNGGAGADRLVGNAGNDTYVVDVATDVVVEGVNGGTDTVRTSLASYVLGANVENLTYTGLGNFNGTGNTLANTITGGAGNDVLNGGAGNDILNGGAGNDTVTGGAGNDTMDASSGNDIFLFAAGFGTDRITGFDVNAGGGQDRINIAALNITAATFASRVTIIDAGADTLLNFGGADSIRLVGVADATTVTATDFLLS